MGPLELLRPLCQPACVFDEPGHEPIQQDGEPHAAPPPTHHCQRSAPFAQAACRQVAASVASVAWLNLRTTRRQKVANAQRAADPNPHRNTVRMTNHN